MAKTFDNSKRLIRLHELMHICGLSRSTIQILESEGKFPKRIKITDKAIAWDYEEVMAWIEKKKEGKK